MAVFCKRDFCFPVDKMFSDRFQILDFSHGYEWQLKFKVKKLFSFMFQLILNIILSEHNLLGSMVLESYASLFLS